MEIYFLALLLVMMAAATGTGYPVAFAIPGASILTVAVAALGGFLFDDNIDAFFVQGGPGVAFGRCHQRPGYLLGR